MKTGPHEAKRAAVYTRISRDKSGEKLGVERQRESCTELARQLGLEIVERYSDNDLSAYSGKLRPDFERMLNDMRDGKFDALLVWHPDRLYRRLDDLARLFDAAPKIEIRSVNGGTLDLSNASGKMLATILGGVSSYESEHKIERQLAAARQKAEKGKPQWRRAFGYLPETRDKKYDDGMRMPDPQTAPLVKEAYRAILAGSSLKDVARLFNDAGAYGLNGKVWTESAVSLFLRAPRNAGLRSHRGEIVGPGVWPGLVDVSMWRAAQDRLNAPGRAPGRKSVRRHPLTGVLLCGNPGCGGYLSGHWVMQKTGGKPGRPKAGQTKEPHSGKVTHTITYACKRCRGVSVRAEHIEPLLYGLVGKRLARPDAVELVKAEIPDEAEAEAIRSELAALYGELENIGVERGQGLLTGKQAKIATEIIDARISKLELDGIRLGTPEATNDVRSLTADRFRAIVATLMEPTVMPVGKSGRGFDPNRLKPHWR